MSFHAKCFRLIEQGQYRKGSWAVFVQVTDTLGVKFYDSPSVRDWSMVAQECAAEVGIAPKVYGILDIKAPRFGNLSPCNSRFSDRMYGYVTEIVDTDVHIEQHEMDNLADTLRNIGLSSRDSYGNVGHTSDGTTVQFDFDPCYALRNLFENEYGGYIEHNDELISML